MKIRNGFISNSSSASFIIQKSDITKLQIDLIRNGKKFLEFCSNNNFETSRDIEDITYEIEEFWYICEDENIISGNTTMDNFDMKWYLNYIGVSPSKITWCDVVGTDRYGLEAKIKDI